MRRAIVHIGMPRTATTTLQRLLFELRHSLPDRGILYPELTPRSAAEPHLNHQHLGEALDGRRPRRERTELLDALGRMLAATEADVVLLSYEGLSLIPGSAVARHLAGFFGRFGFAMETLATVKPQGSNINSLYTHAMQFLKEPRPFRPFFDSVIGNRRLDYEAAIQPWRAASNGRIRAVALRAPGSDQPIAARVLQELDLLDRVRDLLTERDLARVENPSPGPYMIEAARQLRLRGLHAGFGCPARDVTRYLEKAAQESGLDGTRFHGLNAACLEQVEMRYTPANERFARTVWGESWQRRVAADEPGLVNELAARRLDPAEAADVDRLVRLACTEFGVRARTTPFRRLFPVVAVPRAVLRRARRLLP